MCGLLVKLIMHSLTFRITVFCADINDRWEEKKGWSLGRNRILPIWGQLIYDDLSPTCTEAKQSVEIEIVRGCVILSACCLTTSIARDLGSAWLLKSVTHGHSHYHIFGSGFIGVISLCQYYHYSTHIWNKNNKMRSHRHPLASTEHKTFYFYLLLCASIYSSFAYLSAFLEASVKEARHEAY